MPTIFSPFRDFDLATRPRLTPVSAAAAVPFDAVRTESAVELTFDLPGYAPDQVELSVDRNVLTLTAARDRTLADGATLLVGERRHGAVRRQLRLSDSLDTAAIDASFDNGVLTVRIPVAETDQPHKVEITVGSAPVVETAAIEADSAADAATN